jgi:hypothetical protein
MEAVIEQIIKKRAYGTLSAQERELVREWCGTEEEFMRMKRFLLDVEAISAAGRVEPDRAIKASLDTIFAAKHGGIRANWTPPAETAVRAVQAPVIPIHQRTWVRVAAIALLLLGTAPLWNLADHELSKQGIPEVAKLEKPEAKAGSAVKPEQSDSISEVKDQRDAAAIAGNEMIAGVPARALRTTSPDFGYSVAYDEPSADSSDDSEAAMSEETHDLGRMSVSDAPPLALKGFSAAGIEADLHPDNGTVTLETIAISMADQPGELLDFIVPAF